MDSNAVKIRPIANNFDATKDAKIYYDIMFFDETTNIGAELEIYEVGLYSAYKYYKYSNDGGPWAIPANSLENGKDYKMRCRLFNVDNMWSDFIRFSCEKEGVINFTSPENDNSGATWIESQKQRIDLRINWSQINNDIPQKIKYEFYRGADTIEMSTSKIESEWLYIKNPYPSTGGRVRVKAIPAPGTYVFTVVKSNKTPISINITVLDTDTVDSIAYRIATEANIKAGLKFNLEGSLIQFGIREQVNSVEFTSSFPTELEVEPLLLELPTFLVFIPSGFSVPKVTVISQKGIVTEKVGKPVKYAGVYEPIFGETFIKFYQESGSVRVHLSELYRNNTITPIPDKIRIKRRRLNPGDPLLEYLNSLPNTIASNEVINNQPVRSKEYVLYNKNYEDLMMHSYMSDETKNTVSQVMNEIWDDVGEFNIVKILEDNLHFDDIFYGWDRTVVNGGKYVYSYEPMKNDGVGYSPKQTIVVAPVTIDFEDDFIHDSDSFYRIRLNRLLSDIVINRNSQRFETLNGQFPIVVSNQVNYKTGSISFDVISDQSFMKSNVDIGAEKINNDALMKFITNGKPKLLRTKDGEILVVSITGNPTVKYNQYIAGLATVSFEFVEICPPTFENLYQYGLVYISTNDSRLSQIYDY